MCDNNEAAGRCYEHLYPGLTPIRKGLAMEATRECSVPQCERPVVCRGWCGVHYSRMSKKGTVEGREPVKFSPEPGEQWLPVVGYEGHYEVSDCGRVKSVSREIVGRDGSVRPVIERVLRQTSERYPKVNLAKDGRSRSYRVHILVLTAFVGHRPIGMEALHADDDGRNNRLSNLRWGTHVENGRDRWRNERKINPAAQIAKPTPGQVREALVAIGQGERQKDIAARMGVSRGAISHIARGTTWAHITLGEAS